MAEAEKKDNFWMYIGAIIVVTLVLVMMLKQDETKHLATPGASVTDSQAAAALEKTKKLKNVMVE
jgi:NADH:ubiquinone oxidoreductase subunit 6 (subunit J)